MSYYLLLLAYLNQILLSIYRTPNFCDTIDCSRGDNFKSDKVIALLSNNSDTNDTYNLGQYSLI